MSPERNLQLLSDCLSLVYETAFIIKLFSKPSFKKFDPSKIASPQKPLTPSSNNQNGLTNPDSNNSNDQNKSSRKKSSKNYSQTIKKIT